ncbi:hypothetical protein C7T94_13680 [Pedobacter yulinensis]|uniref:Uncharacterized protein n=1 Tax=Pedobacter yulinensis TaxID=2126353 RepID=A0A2T3HMC7_9SPHI|nr:hypothetical protein [Pedobacter yulinensis]PST83587.1 hypothetical protein C7T94_13680 [Pedobacter yulinensis]
MMHPYKQQLLLNLRTYFAEKPWRITSDFEQGREEIIFIVPRNEDIDELHRSLFHILGALPDIHLPNERVVIGFCLADGSGYRSHLINPNKQDEINLALIGYRPERTPRANALEKLL